MLLVVTAGGTPIKVNRYTLVTSLIPKPKRLSGMRLSNPITLFTKKAEKKGILIDNAANVSVVI